MAQKETGETQYWLKMLYATEYINETEFDSLYANNTEDIMKILTSSIKTKKKNIGLKTITFLVIIAACLKLLL